jgi:hypothetical protein
VGHLYRVTVDLLIVGFIFLKSQPFLTVQMLQHIFIMISIAKRAPRFLLMRLTALYGLNHDGAWTPISLQQYFFAKG